MFTTVSMNTLFIFVLKETWLSLKVLLALNPLQVADFLFFSHTPPHIPQVSPPSFFKKLISVESAAIRSTINNPSELGSNECPPARCHLGQFRNKGKI